MKSLVAATAVVFGASTVAAAASQPSRFEIELEAGPVWQSRNDVEIPNDGTATRFSLEELVGAGPWPTGRAYFTWNIARRHGLRLLLAPLGYTETGRFNQPVSFAGATYAPAVATEATYRFDSWRATYRYRFKVGERWNWWVGFTAKVRDAEIELRQGATTSRDTDLGFVPLAHIHGDFRFAERWHLLLDADALAGGPGRAEDFAVKVRHDLTGGWAVAFGYRTLEGGADVDEVYNFAWFNYAVVSGSYHWGGGR